jgi:CDP-glucose 4,6-dehydratase
MSYWKRKRVFITGATGLVGGWLVDDLLRSGAEIVCLVRDHTPKSYLQSRFWNQVIAVHGDVRDTNTVTRALQEYRIEVVFHLAAQTLVETALNSPAETWSVNVGGTTAVMESCLRAKKWLEACVVASTDKVYGDHDGTVYHEDSTNLDGHYPYDASKVCTEIVASSYALTYGVPVAMTRCGNFFGGADFNMSRIVPGTIRDLFDGKAPRIRSDGSMVRDYFYVKDGALGYKVLAEKLAAAPEIEKGPCGLAYNFSYEEPISVLAIVQKIQTIMGTDLEPIIENRVAGEIPKQVLSAQKARKELGWKPAYTMDAALRETVAWYTEFLRQNAVAREDVSRIVNVSGKGEA